MMVKRRLLRHIELPERKLIELLKRMNEMRFLLH
jgi:hypothetical protein